LKSVAWIVDLGLFQGLLSKSALYSAGIFQEKSRAFWSGWKRMVSPGCVGGDYEEVAPGKCRHCVPFSWRWGGAPDEIWTRDPCLFDMATKAMLWAAVASTRLSHRGVSEEARSSSGLY